MTPDSDTFDPNDAVARQHWPSHALYVVATPIGNRADLSPRARHALQLADVIAAEDTRTSRALLDYWHITTPMVATHQHNEAQMAETLLARLAAGERVALISDAGTPAVSDPGARLVRAVREAGWRVVPLPGPSAVLAALMASGLADPDEPGFAFAGFAPGRSQARQTWLRRWSTLPVPVVLFESPHRLAAMLRDLQEVCGPTRELTLARELTKRFEEIVTLPLGEASAWLDAQPRGAQGEFALVLAPAPPPDNPADTDHDRLLLALLERLSVRDAAKVAAQATGAPRQVLYQRALTLRDSAAEPVPTGAGSE